MIEPTDKTVEIKSASLHKLIVGKTIRAIDDSADNVLYIDFTDGTEIMFEADTTGMHNLAIIVPRRKAGPKKSSPVCIACNGSGYYDGDGNPKCGACGGTGLEPARR